MKNLLTILLLLAVTVVFGQKKYYYCTASFSATDGCFHDYWLTFQSNGNPGYYDIKNKFTSYIKPYKVDRKTFQITSLKQLSRSEYLKWKGKKYSKCKPDTDLNIKSAITSCDTCRYKLESMFKPNKFVFMGITGDLLDISSRNSTGYYVIKFAKSKVKFINDSTFTFKTQN